MSSPGSSNPAKRRRDAHVPVSPPPVKRRVQSGTTKSAVASFFTPASQKPPPKMIWQERAADAKSPNTLIVGKYAPEESEWLRVSRKNDNGEAEKKRRKVAAFDFDSTLISTASGKAFASDAQDWKWWHTSILATLRNLYAKEGFRIVVISNQAGISLKPDTKAPKAHQSKYGAFKTKVAAVFEQLDFPISIYAATEKDIFRKPRVGMWKELLEDYDIHLPGDLDLQGSMFIGDAGGRDAASGLKKDFSCSDRSFADNVGIRFQTPEEFFLGEAPRPFTRTIEPADYISDSSIAKVQPVVKSNDQDIVLFCGSPGAGKSTLYWKYLEPLGYARVNQDTLKTRDRCLKVAADYLKEGQSVVVDNTNADIDVRSKWIDLATKHNVPIRCLHFTAKPELCSHNDVVRALNSSMNPENRTILPSLAFSSFKSRFQPPKIAEGFQDVVEVDFKFNGTDAEREIWRRHWT